MKQTSYNTNNLFGHISEQNYWWNPDPVFILSVLYPAKSVGEFGGKLHFSEIYLESKDFSVTS